MKILINSKNNRTNWGARSTGRALFQLLSKAHSCEEFDGIDFEVKTSFDLFIDRVTKNRNAIYLNILLIVKELFIKLHILNRSVIICTNDVDETINNLVRYQNRSLPNRNILNGIEQNDAIVINGEGSMIFGNPIRREIIPILSFIKIAKQKGKKAFLINTMVSESPSTGFNQLGFNKLIPYFELCDKIIVRDRYSYNFIKNNSNLSNVLFCPDALFSWVNYINNGLTLPNIEDEIIPFPEKNQDFGKYNFKDPYICISGSSFYITSERNVNYYNLIIKNYSELIERLKLLNVNIYLVETCKTDSFLFDVAVKTNTILIPNQISLLHGIAILSNSKILIGGRYHPGIMASLNGTPCVFFNSNSHKTASLQELLEYDDIKVFSSELSSHEITDIVEIASYLLLNNDQVRVKIKNTVEKLSALASKIPELLT